MAGTLTHSPADVLRRVLIALAQGTDPSDNGAWPIYASREPNLPDNAITVYDTQGRDDGRRQTDGERMEHFGFQVRTRAIDFPTGYTKARAVAVVMDKNIYDEAVTLDSTNYLLHSVSRTTDVLYIGDDPASRRALFTVNGVLTVKQV